MELGKVFIDDVKVGERHRQVDAAKVSGLAESMKALGLQQPISVYVESDNAILLVAGLHRLEAARSLGWEEIEASFVHLSEIDRELWEIDENLSRSELTTDEKRDHLRRRKELWEKRQVERGNSVPTLRSAAPGQKGFAAETAAATGLSKRQINKLLAEPKPVAPARPAINEFESVERQVDRLMAAWNAAGPEAREDFLNRIDTSVFDNTRAA
jgi:hypothetical protein